MRALVLAILAIGCEPSHREPPAQSVPPSDPRVELAHDLAQLATGVAATPEDIARIAQSNYSSEAYSKYISELLVRPQAGPTAMRAISIIGGTRGLIPMATLKTTQVEGQTIYYLHEPCTKAEAETVRPWWDLDARVLVCPAAHRPTVFKTTEDTYCSGTIASPKTKGSPCGCGPNLMRCLRDEQDLKLLAGALTGETSATFTHVVTSDLPFETVFTSQESFRTGAAEFQYQRWLVEDGWYASIDQLPDWRKWPKQGQWAPRLQAREHQHAGILTNLFYPQAGDSQRLRLQQNYYTLWCMEGDSRRVMTSTVLDAGKHLHNSFRRDVNENDLATREGCGDCHARLDYGVPFFAGDQWFHKVDHYIARAQIDTEGKLYGRNIEDARGSAPRNPEGFAKYALSQPEFPRCMSRRIIEHVFNDMDRGGPALDEKLQAIVKRRGTYRELMSTALEQYKNERLAKHAAPAAPHADGKLHAQLVNLCADCHDGEKTTGPGRAIAAGDKWCSSRATDCTRDAIDMLTLVAYGEMPQEAPLPDAERTKLVRALAAVAYPDPATRNAAIAFFLANQNATAVHTPDAILSRISANTGVKEISIPRIGTWSRFGLTVGAYAAVGAAKACKGKPDEHACILAAFADPQVFAK